MTDFSEKLAPLTPQQFRVLGVRNRTQAVIAIQQMEIDPSDTSLSGS